MPACTTTRTPARRTDGALVARWAALLGRPLLPWQRHVADLAGELDPYTGRHAYQRVVLIVPRRAGKSLLMLARALATCTTPRRRAFYTSAHRENAARMWRDDWFRAVADVDPAGRHLTLTRGNGQEAIAFTRADGGSTFRLVAPSGSAIRGAATNLVVIDEARELTVEEGAELEAAVFPTQATGAGGQTWIVSNAGDADALWLARWRDLGRQAVADDSRNGICYVEYAAPLDADPDDPDTWYAAHPGLAAGNVHVESVAADRAVMTPDAFGAEYLGWWPETLVDSELVDAWDRATTDTAAPANPVVFALELDVERTVLSIVAVGRDDGRAAVELVTQRPHGAWLVDELTRLVREHRPIAVVWDAAGPVGALAHDLDRVPANLVALGTRDVVAACGRIHDVCLSAGLAHRDDPAMTAAVAAARRKTALGAWVYDRRQPGSGPWIGAALALWVHQDRSRAAPNVR